MNEDQIFKIQTKAPNLYLRVAKGHFATNHSHINYYIDVTAQKMKFSESKAVAEALINNYKSSKVIDTILCLDGTETIGACLAELLTRSDFTSINANKEIYVVPPEHTTGSQLIFRDNTSPMIKGKHVLVLAASVVTGYTAESAIDAINYYGGEVVGIASIFATLKECLGIQVTSVFNPNDLPGYTTYAPKECPLCKQGQKLDALVNMYGYSEL